MKLLNRTFFSFLATLFLLVSGHQASAQRPIHFELKWLRQPKKDLLAYFPEKKKEIMQFATQNNLSFTKPEHLARIVEFCNRF